ncbi:MAG: ArsB/NhaD family transporter [Anaerolineaceae bacterium]|nr:ArsB/NhaD family transporter [Anaerolineaceae bacterium]
MKKTNIIFISSIFIALLLSVFFGKVEASTPNAQVDDYKIVSRLFNNQDQPIEGAEIQLFTLKNGEEILVSETESFEDGSWTLHLESVPDNLSIHFYRPHYAEVTYLFNEDEINQLKNNQSLIIDEMMLKRKTSIGFWAAVAIFFGVLLIIAMELMHSTTASLLAMSSIFLVSFVGGAFSKEMFIFDFEKALSYINWEVIFLVMGMMIIIAVIERTGIFQWTAFQAYRLSRGKAWVLVIILMLVTAVASALLDNFTTMLLMTPISLQIGLALGINPIALIIPEILASNVGGISTLIGTPTNIIIGAYADIGFVDFLVNQTLGVVLALVMMAGYVVYFYRSEWNKQSNEISPKLYELLKKNGQIKDKRTLIVSGLTFVLVLVGFILGEKIHIPPAVPALIGATALFVVLKPDVTKTIEAVDWTTLVFFMSLFIVVGAVQEVGFISMIADLMQKLVQGNEILAIIVIVFGVGTLSTSIANIPLAASMLPVVEFLSGSIPGAASSKVLYYALSMGAAMGGNGFLIGGEANLVTAGITEQAGTPISFKDFMKIGIPVTYITLAVGTIWLIIRFVLFG